MSNSALEKLKRSGEIETLLPDNDRYTNRFEIKSESSNRIYTIAQNKSTGEWSCSCPGWIIARNGVRACKHLRELQPLLAEATKSSSRKQLESPVVVKKTKVEEMPDIEIDNEDPFFAKTSLKDKWAKLLTGREIGNEISKKEETQAKKDGVVIVFGASDDLIEFRGAIYDEADRYGGGEVFVDSKGLLPDEDDEYFTRKKKAKKIEAVWGGKKADWTYKTKIPNSTFKILEDGNIYCIGIVFELKDLK